MSHYQIGFANQNNGYPMYFQVKTDDQLGFRKVVDFCHTEELKIGDTLDLRDGRTEYIVAEIIEVRKPKGEHIEAALFQRVSCDGGHKV